LQNRVRIDIEYFEDDYCIHATKQIVITFDHFYWMIRLDWYDFHFNTHVDRILLKFSSCKLLSRVRDNQMKWFKIRINSANAQLISNVFSKNVFESFICLKANSLFYEMQNRLIDVFYLDIDYVHYDVIIKFQVIF
jgi:hypothetical protein